MNQTQHLVAAAELIYKAMEHIEKAGKSATVEHLQRVLHHLYVLIAILGKED